jgi:hypothetical protein
MPRPRRTRSLSPSSEIRGSLSTEEEGLERNNRDRVELANLSLPANEPSSEFPIAGRARLSTKFGVPLFHLDGRRDRENTVAWWPYDIKRSTSLEISKYRRRTPREQLRETRLYLNRVENNWQGGDEGLGDDEDFRICDANGARMIKLQDHCPGAVH